jgi:hypothetical protein
MDYMDQKFSLGQSNTHARSVMCGLLCVTWNKIWASKDQMQHFSCMPVSCMLVFSNKLKGEGQFCYYYIC